MQASIVPLSGKAVYQSPTANAGPIFATFVGTAVTLNGAGSTNPQHLPLDYEWTLVSRPATSTAGLVNALSEAAKLTPDVQGTYTIELVIRNQRAVGATDSVVVTAAPPSGTGGSPPSVTGTGELTLSGSWRLRFFSGDDDEASWLRIGSQPEFEWEEDETPGRIVAIDFGTTADIVRVASEMVEYVAADACRASGWPLSSALARR